MKIIIKDLLEYFDIKESTDFGDTTATISIVGEDLCSAIFKHYCESNRGSKVTILDPNLHIPTTMRKKGRRLDRWILEANSNDQILYQTEIKNWCSRAIGGVNVPLVIDATELDRLAEINWSHHYSEFISQTQNGLNKVLINMISDQRLSKDSNLSLNLQYSKEPLLLLWHVCKPKDEKNFFYKFTLPETHHHYDYCRIFSCSLYLRDLCEKNIESITIDMPNVSRRLDRINLLFKS